MHPEIKEKKPGKCPICGMDLVKENGPMQQEKNTYTPLIIVLGMIVLVTLSLTTKDIFNGNFLINKSITYFMIGFFLVFSGFKLMDLKGFSKGYSMYDLLAKKWFGYGYIYPFIELFFGISMIVLPTNKLILLSEIIVMAFSGAGVVIKLLKHEKFQCACLGTFLKVPLTKITLIEDFGMAFLAILLFSMN